MNLPAILRSAGRALLAAPGRPVTRTRPTTPSPAPPPWTSRTHPGPYGAAVLVAARDYVTGRPLAEVTAAHRLTAGPVRQGARVLRHPDLAAEVRDGTLALSTAHALATLREQAPDLAHRAEASRDRARAAYDNMHRLTARRRAARERAARAAARAAGRAREDV